MITVYLPVIHRNDYETFRTVMGRNLPDTHDEWRYLALKKKDEAVLCGHEVFEIEVYPDEFVGYASLHGDERTLHALQNFAFEKGTRKAK
jgi:hypothetical protein